MGYSKSIKTLDSFYEYVQPLERGEPYTWITEPGMTGKLAYKIRESLYIARIHADKYPRLAEVAAHFSIQEVDSTKVQAVWSSAPTEALVLSGGYATVSPQHGGTTQTPGRVVSTSGEQTVFTIIETWRRSQPSNNPIYFASANLSDAQLRTLWVWSQECKPPLMIMLGDEGSLTLGPVDDEVVQYAYRPADAPPVAEPMPSGPIPPKPHW